MKKLPIFALAALLLFAFPLSACGGGELPPATSSETPPAEEKDPSEETPEPEPEPEPEPAPEPAPLVLSHESGVYAAPFLLTAEKADENNVIRYTLDGSRPTGESAPLGGGVQIGVARTEYPLTNGVLWQSDTYGNYVFGTGNECTVIRLAELNAAGETVAERTETYFIRAAGEAAFPLPVVSIVMPQETALSFYNDIVNESKERAEVAYFDFASGERFALNSQIKVGGNWTKGYPYRTMNLNFNKDENGKKNTPVTVELFGDRTARDGSELTNFTRFRLHSGGNSQVISWFGDAFTQKVAAECASRTGEKLQVATTGYRPCEVYLNGEYWGLYAIREHYSDVYFAQNYGVDKDEVLLVDRTTGVTETNDVFNRKYAFELAEDNEAEDGSGMQKAVSFFDFLMGNDFSEDAMYRELEKKVDLTSLADLLLTHFYAGNWDFSYNNIKMWRTDAVDPENPYADGRWRFCLHDLDFSFENQFGDAQIVGANCFECAANYLDFYLGNADLSINGLGRLSPEMTCLFRAPMQNEKFRTLLRERAAVVQEVFETARAQSILDGMQAEVETAMHRHLARWQRSDYGIAAWRNAVANTHAVLRDRVRVFWDNSYDVYPDGDYFIRQVEATIARFR